MSERTVTVEATGRRSAPPEQATVEVRAVGSGRTPAVARESSTDRAETVRTAVAAVEAQFERVRTVRAEVEHRERLFEYDDDPAYRAIERLAVDCRTAAAGAVVSAALDTGATVPTVQFSLSAETRQRLREDALDAAMDHARRRAERLAAAEELELGAVVSVTEADADSGMDGLVDAALTAGSDDDFSPDPVTVSASVEVVYELGDA